MIVSSRRANQLRGKFTCHRPASAFAMASADQHRRPGEAWTWTGDLGREPINSKRSTTSALARLFRTQVGRSKCASFDHIVGAPEEGERELTPSALAVDRKRHADRVEEFKHLSR